MCCVIGYGKDISEAEVCRMDGLCYSPGYDRDWRESCTDPTWQHPACIKLFVNSTGFDGDEPARDGKCSYGRFGRWQQISPNQMV